jgi:hypothetical protein
MSYFWVGLVLFLIATGVAVGAYALRARNRAVDDYNERKKKRRLVFLWKKESVEDLRAYHTMEAEEELVAAISKEIALEIDREVVRDLDLKQKTADKSSKDIIANVLLDPVNRVADKIDENLAADLKKFEEERLADIGQDTTVKKCMTCKALYCDCQQEMFSE